MGVPPSPILLSLKHRRGWSAPRLGLAEGHGPIRAVPGSDSFLFLLHFPPCQAIAQGRAQEFGTFSARGQVKLWGAEGGGEPHQHVWVRLPLPLLIHFAGFWPCDLGVATHEPQDAAKGDFTQRCQGTSNQVVEAGHTTQILEGHSGRKPSSCLVVPEHLTPGSQGSPGGTGCSMWQVAGRLGGPGGGLASASCILSRARGGGCHSILAAG